VLIWFAVVSAVAVAEIFGSPMVDYRMVALGSVLPVVDVVVGQPTPLHTLAAPVGVLTIVMLATVGRRLVRRRLLGLPIGMFLHLVLDASWGNAQLFWWPAFGNDLSAFSVPESSAIAIRVLLDVIGVGVAVWAYKRYGLADPENRERLIRSGHLDRSYLTS